MSDTENNECSSCASKGAVLPVVPHSTPPGAIPRDAMTILRATSARPLGQPLYVSNMTHPTSGIADPATGAALSDRRVFSGSASMEGRRRGEIAGAVPQLQHFLMNPADHSSLGSVLRSVFSKAEFAETGLLPVELSGSEIDWGEVARKILEGPPEIRSSLWDLLWWVFFGWNVGLFYTWPKQIAGLIARIIRERKAGWNEPFDHDWTCRGKCQYWKRKADWIVNKKHGGSKGKLGHNEHDLASCLECCDDYRSCSDDLRRGSDNWFTWLTGIP